MISLLPTTTAADTQGAFAILALLTDDNKFKQRLTELIEAAKTAEQRYNAAVDSEKAARALVKDAEDKIAAADKKIAEAQSVQRQAYTDQAMLRQRAIDLDAYKVELEKKADAAFAERERVTCAKESQLATYADHLALDKEEFDRWVTYEKKKAADIAEQHKNTTAALNFQIAQLAQKHDEADALKRDLQARLEKVKSIVGGV